MGSLWHPTRWRDRQIRGGYLIGASGVGENLWIPIDGAEYQELLHDQPWHDNIVTDEGEAWILNVAFRNNDLSGFTSFEVLLDTGGALVETSTIASVTELGDGSGYAAKTVNRNTTDWSAPTGTNPTYITTPATGTHTWTCTGSDWASVVEQACLVTVGMTTDRLIAFADLGGGAGRDINVGDSLDLDLDVNAGGS